MNLFTPLDPTAALASGLLVVRLILGLAIAAHGAQKLFGWFGGHGLAGTGAFFESIGYHPGRLFAAAAGAGELTAGALTALGLLGPVGPALLVMVMLVALASVHAGNGFFASSNGVELPLLYATAALGLAFSGPGAFSLDALLGLRDLWTPALSWLAIGVALLAALLNLSLRHRGEPHAAGAR